MRHRGQTTTLKQLTLIGGINGIMENKVMPHNDIYRLEQIILAVERLNYKCEDNMKRLNNMMLELKGIVAMVRPMAKKNDWYKDEINTNDVKTTLCIEINPIELNNS